MARQSIRMSSMSRRRDSGSGNGVQTTYRNFDEAELGGVIFGCTADTFDECILKQLFGLPRAHLKYVELIQKTLPLFLFNYTERRLYGVFQAASQGALIIDDTAWTLYSVLWILY